MLNNTRFKELRKSKGITLEKLGQQLGLSANTLCQYEKGQREPSFETIETLAKLYNVTIGYLLGVEDMNNTKKHGIRIPVLGSIPAGIPLEAIEDILDYEEIYLDTANKGEYFALRVKGTSMLPTIRDGDTVIIKRQDDAESGKICVVMINGYDATLKEIKKDLNGIYIIPHNPNDTFKPTFYSNHDIEELPIRILGIAVEIRRNI